MDTAIPESFQIQIPYVLKRHGRYGEGFPAGHFQKDIVRYTVELKENRSKPRGFERFGIPSLTGQSQTVGVELYEWKPVLLTHFDDLRQVVPNRGLPPES